MKILLTFIVFFSLSYQLYAAPIISNFSGSPSDDSQIVISGSSFGNNGPRIVIFDDFNRGINGQTVTQDATIGNWSNVSPNYYDVDGNLGALLVDGTRSRQLQIDFDATQEIFLSYNVQIPPGGYFPNTSCNECFAPDSAWKLAWIYDADGGYAGGGDDIVLPSYPNGHVFSIGGNAGVPDPSYLRIGNKSTTRWFGFYQWNRLAFWLKGGQPNPFTNHGIVASQGMSPEFGQITSLYTDRVLFKHVGQWTRLNLSGWHRSSGNAVYDNIYFATGPNAAARVEIGNASIYANATKLAIATPDIWTDTKITATVRKGDFSESDAVYLFVVNAKNEPSAGYGPIFFGGGTSEPVPVEPVPVEPVPVEPEPAQIYPPPLLKLLPE